MEYKHSKVVVVVFLLFLFSFDVFVPTSAHPLSFLDMQFVQICFIVSFYITKTYNGLILPQFIPSMSIAHKVVVVVVAASSCASARLTFEIETHSPSGSF